MKLITACLFTLLSYQSLGFSSANKAEIIEREVSYQADGKKMVGFLAAPAKPESKAPGILVIHEWWGQTDYPRKRARMLAEMGFVGFAVDMYGDRKTADHPKDAGGFAKAVMSDAKVVSSRFNAALETLKKQPEVDPAKIGSIGYCFGGSVNLEMARQGVDIAGVVSFHGGLKTPSKAKAGNVNTKILVLHGEDDKFITAAEVTAFLNEMKAANADYEFVAYPGAVHGFTNPAATDNGKRLGIPLAYHPEADEKSWAKMVTFFDSLFGRQKD